jgi:hypothetical protein
MDNRSNAAVLLTVDVGRGEGSFPVTVTYESRVETHHNVTTLDGVWALACHLRVRRIDVLFRGWRIANRSFELATP